MLVYIIFLRLRYDRILVTIFVFLVSHLFEAGHLERVKQCATLSSF